MVLAALGVYGARLLDALQRRHYNFASARTERTASGRIAIIAIDNSSINNLGGLPWWRSLHARLKDHLAAANVKTVAHSLSLFGLEVDRNRASIRPAKKAFQDSREAGATHGRLGGRLTQIMDEAEFAHRYRCQACRQHWHHVRPADQLREACRLCGATMHPQRQ
jgi:hypothetical protein